MPDNNSPANSNNLDQSLEAQNIFDLLGVSDGTEQEKEAFLDELQEVLWKDFLENDLSLLLTEEELADFKKIDVNNQEEQLKFLQKLIPDLEEIMLEKALELKEEMVRERIAGMREYYAAKQTALEQITQAENFVSQNQWRSAANVLNAVV